jgi:hypothetical protein
MRGKINVPRSQKECDRQKRKPQKTATAICIVRNVHSWHIKNCWQTQTQLVEALKALFLLKEWI